MNLAEEIVLQPVLAVRACVLRLEWRGTQAPMCGNDVGNSERFRGPADMIQVHRGLYAPPLGAVTVGGTCYIEVLVENGVRDAPWLIEVKLQPLIKCAQLAGSTPRDMILRASPDVREQGDQRATYSARSTALAGIEHTLGFAGPVVDW